MILPRTSTGGFATLLAPGQQPRLIYWSAAPLLKAASAQHSYGPIPPGARFVTLHPNGKGTEGQVVLIVPSSAKPGHWVVHGGAGNKLNGLVLTGIKTQAEYDHDRKERDAARRTKEAKDKAERVKNGTQDAFQAKQQQIQGEAANARERADLGYIERMAPLLGIDKWRFEDLNNTADLVRKYGEGAVNTMKARHRQNMIRQIHELRDAARQTLLADDDVRQVVLANDPNATAENQLGIPDVVPEPLGGGLGYDPERKDRQADKHAQDVQKDAFKQHGDTLDEAIKDQQEQLKLAGVDGAGKAYFDTSVKLRQDLLQAAERAATGGDTVRSADLLAQIERENRLWDKRLGGKDPAGAIATSAKFSAIARQIQGSVQSAKAAGDVKQASFPQTTDQANVIKELLKADREHAEKLKQIKLAEKHLGDSDQSVIDDAYAVDAFRVAEAISPDKVDAKVRQQIETDVGTSIAHSLLNATEDPDELLQGMDVKPEALQQAMEHHLAGGAYDAMNLAALAATGKSTVDRDAVAVLGIKGAAQMLARHLDKTMTRQDYGDLVSALEDYQSGQGLNDAKAALDDTKDLAQEARGFQLDQVATGDDFLQAALLNRLKHNAVRDAVQRVGEAAGAMQGRAELIWALKQRGKLGKVDADIAIPGDVVAVTDCTGRDMLQVIRGARALGMSVDDYDIKHTDDHQYLLLRASAVAKVCGEKETPEEIATRNQVSAITSGKQDEQGWLPKGMASRPRTTFATPAGAVAKYAPIPNLRGSHLSDGIQEYVGGMVADGADASDVLRDMLRPDFMRAHVDDDQAYQDKLAELLPLPSLGNGQADAIQKCRDVAQAWADEVRSKANDPVTALHRQRIDTDDTRVYDAIHRTLAAYPPGVVAFKPVGQLTQADHRVLRDAYVSQQRAVYTGQAWQRIAGKPRDQLSPQEQKPYEQQVEHDVEAAHPADAVWDAYAKSHPDAQDAYGRLLGSVRAQTLDKLAAHYSDVTGQQLRSARVQDGLQLGDQVEAQLGSIWGNVAHRFDGKTPLRLYSDLRMDGDKAAQQRAIKMLAARKKAYWALGTGSGKTITSIGAFAHLHAAGKVDRALFIAPSGVQGQFSADMLRTLDPGANGGKGFEWYSSRGHGAKTRRAAYADPKKHMVITTPQALRDDIHYAVAQSENIPEQSVGDHLQGLSRSQRSTTIARAIRHMHWDSLVGPKGMSVADEAHYLSNRAGKDNSQIANVIDAIGDLNSHHVLMSGTPIKNDPSEAFDILSKVAPDHFKDRAAFMRKYGTHGSREALRRELKQYMYADRIRSGRQAQQMRGDHGKPLPLTAEQQAAYKQVLSDYQAVRKANHHGQVALDAMQRLSPNAFKGKPAADHEAIARRLQESAGGIRDWALSRVVNNHDWKQNAKLQHLIKLADNYRGQGKPGVIFAHNLEAVRQASQALQANGHRVVVLTGADNAADKDAKRLAFAPEGGAQPTADIMICSDAGATGLNLQRGKWMAHLDVPQTSVVHEQRTARIDRLGQTDDVEIHNLVSNTPFDLMAERRIREKADLGRVAQTPNGDLDDVGLQGLFNSRRAARLLQKP